MNRITTRRAADSQLAGLIGSLIDEARDVLAEALPLEQSRYVSKTRGLFRQYRRVAEVPERELDTTWLAEVYGYSEGLPARNEFCDYLACTRPFVKRFKRGRGNCGIAVPSPEQTAKQVVQRFLDRNGSLTRNSRSSNQIAHQLCSFYSTEQVLIEYVQYIDGVKLEAQAARFGSIVLEPLSEIEEIYNIDPLFKQAYDNICEPKPSHRIQALARLRLRRQEPMDVAPQDSNENNSRSLAEFADVVNALRVRARRPIGASRIKSVRYIQPFYNMPIFMGIDQVAPRLAYSVLKQSDLLAVRKMFRKLLYSEAKSGVMDLTLRRLKYADSRGDIEDRVLDLFICAELILRVFCSGKVHTNNYNMSRFFAKLISNNGFEEAEIHGHVSDAYLLRNDILHGRTLTKEAQERGHNRGLTVERLESIVKRSLQKLITIRKVEARPLSSWLQ